MNPSPSTSGASPNARASARLADANFAWIVVAVFFTVAMFGAYVALFRGVIGEQVDLRWKDSYDITMAGLAATRLFSAGGAGGIVLTYWALRKAGMPRKETASRMVAFLVLLPEDEMHAVIPFRQRLERRGEVAQRSGVTHQEQNSHAELGYRLYTTGSGTRISASRPRPGAV